MLFFALFTAGYFLGVFTVLIIFPPNTKEIEEQEKDALTSTLAGESQISEAVSETLIDSPVLTN